MDWLAYAKEIAKTTRGYAAFLRQHKTDIAKVRRFEDLPVMDKKSYIAKFSLEELTPWGAVPSLAYASSGSSGRPTVWFRNDEQEFRGADMHERVVRDIWKIKKSERTLVVVCFSMGIWVAGSFTAAVFRELSRRGYAITTITPGIERGDIFAILRDLAPRYTRVILAGYPPFVLDVLREIKSGVAPMPPKLNILTAGDAVSEEMRDEYLALTGSTDPAFAINLYGCADAGPLAYETPETIAFRRAMRVHAALRRACIGADDGKIPALFAYRPDDIYFEERGGELLFSAKTAIPLIRYNIHDIGALYRGVEINALLKTHGVRGVKFTNDARLVLKRGRTDVAVTFYALNIYPEHIAAGLAHPKIRRMVSGQYIAHTTVGRKTGEVLHLVLESAPGVPASARLRALAQQTIANELAEHNMEYRKLRDTLGAAALPQIRLVSNMRVPVVERPSTDKRQNSNARGAILGMKGKKPKMMQVNS